MSFDPSARRSLLRRRPAGALDVSLLGVGTAPFGALAPAVTDESVQDAFAAMHGAGLRYFDTAPLYGTGLAEHRLGACLRRIDRRELVLSTKVGRLLKPLRPGIAAGASAGKYPFEVRYDYSYDGTMRSLEHSLQRLGTNAIDIALIHDVNRRWQGDLVEQRYAEAMAGAYRALVELRDAGVIKAIGVGVNDWTILERFAADGDFDCFMLAGRYTLLDHTALESFFPDCARRKIAVLMAAPFNSGILATGATPGATFFYTEASPEIVARTRRIEAVCARHGVAIAAAALQFPLAHPVVASVVTGMRAATEARANIAHCAAAIPPAFWQELKHENLIAAAAPVPGDA
ncbi:MAG: aldo/keto reductase [Casimicrobiaceae bacterium]